ECRASCRPHPVHGCFVSTMIMAVLPRGRSPLLQVLCNLVPPLDGSIVMHGITCIEHDASSPGDTRPLSAGKNRPAPVTNDKPILLIALLISATPRRGKQ